MVAFDGKSTDDSSRAFKLLDPGIHLLKIASIQLAKTKGGDTMWNLKLITEDGKNWVYDRVVWSERAKSRSKQFLKCFGIYDDDKHYYETFELEGKSAPVKVGVEVIQGGKYVGRDGNCIPFDGYHTYEKTAHPGPAQAEKPKDDERDIPF